MAISDDTQLIFSSGWAIEQQVLHTTKTLTLAAPTQNFTTFQTDYHPVLLQDYNSLNLTFIPRFIVTFRTAGQTRWNMNGAADRLGNSIFAFAKSDGIYVQSMSGGFNAELRYTIYSDTAVI